MLWRLYILLVPMLNAHAGSDKDKCQFPEINSPKPPLYAYQQTGSVSVTVYHCFYQETYMYSDTGELCPKCKEGNSNFEIGKTTYRYSDITKNCADAFTGKKFTSKFGVSHPNGTVTYECKCNDNATLNKIVTVRLTEYQTQANVGKDQIRLESGSVCRYTTGFCHDENKDIDVMWEVEEHVNNCSLYSQLNARDLYFFKLNGKEYAILESANGYFPLKLRKKDDKCGVSEIWATQHNGLVVTKGPIKGANSKSLYTTDHLKFHFKDKQDLYDYLSETCQEKEQTSELVQETSVATRIQLGDQNITVGELKADIESLKSESLTYFYVFIFMLLLLVMLLASIVAFLIWMVFRRNSVINCSISEVAALKSNVRATIAPYDYITYDINSV